MDPFDRQIYDDFYMAYFDAAGSITYPSDEKEVKVIKEMLKKSTNDGFIYLEDRDLYYKMKVKRKIVDGKKIQMVAMLNVTEFMNQVSKASVDEITHLNNRKMARNLFMQYIERAYMKQENFAIIFADLDGFKEVNDTYGHTNGDIVLGEVSRIMFCSTRHEPCREQDIVARIGGDEFVVILKNITEDNALKKAEKVRNDVENHQVALFKETGMVEYINAGTLSIGLYYVSIDELNELYNRGYTTDEIRTLIIDRCDSALYSSKNNGKNRITEFNKIKKLVKDN